MAVLAPTTTVNEVGEEEQGWSVLASLWAARLSLRLAEVNRMAGTVQAAEAKYLVRYRTDIKPTMRLQEGDQTLEITSVEEVGGREGLNLFVRLA